jgi:uncharacterized membrane protein
MTEPISTPPPPESDIPEDDRLLAILAYVPLLCLIPFMKTDRSDFVTGHVRLGVTLFVIEVFALILRYLRVVWDVIILLCVIAALAGIVNVVRGRKFSIPYISDIFSRKF